MKKFLLFFIIVISVSFFVIHNKKDKYTLLDNTIDNMVSINKYYIYGNHLNIFGEANIDSYDTVSLVLKSLNNEIDYNIDFDNKHFSTSNYINEGIYLDDIPIDDYFLFLKVSNNDEIKYYNLSNNTKYNNTSYYTISKNGQNNLIDIAYSSYSNKEFFKISVNNEILPNDYYDIVIDAGHGGDDPGASYASHNEADITLDYALGLKEALERIGLKVKLTRDSDKTIDSYGYGSRTGIVYESHAKYVFSIHLNSTDESMKSGGVEIYSPNLANLDFASNLAKSIIDNSGAKYSRNESFKVSNGVYVRTFTKNDIAESVATAKTKGFNPYPITVDTTYYFMIRETGGIATNAYVDGRNKSYGKNYYFDSNIGAEGYLMELGFINYWGDLNNLLNNKDKYINGIVSAIKEEINL